MEELTNGWMLAGGAALLTIFATGWSHVKNLYSQIAGRVVVKLTVSGYQADAILMYLKHHYTSHHRRQVDDIIKFGKTHLFFESVCID